MTRVLVTAASKHGSTEEIADRIAKTLRSVGHEVIRVSPNEVTELAGLDAVVLGSGVYFGHWMPEATALAQRIGEVFPRPQVWLFSSGPAGDPSMAESEALDVAEVMDLTSAEQHRLFAGKIDKARLSLAERAILRMVRASEGDFRDWDDVDSWARQIGAVLARSVSTGEPLP